jgi:hypothetical protein
MKVSISAVVWTSATRLLGEMAAKTDAVTCQRVLYTRGNTSAVVKLEAAGPGALAPDEEAATAAPPTVAAKNPKSLPGTMAATNPTPAGFTEAVKAPFELGVDVRPP